MWLSETKRRLATEVSTASVCTVTDGDDDVLCAGGILRLPKTGETQLRLSGSDGSSVLLGVVGSDTPDGLLPGEVYIKTDSAAITIKNNGAVNITGTVNITGSLTVNGTSVG